MKRLIVLALMALMAVPVLAQQDDSKKKATEDEVVFIDVEKSAEFPGGMEALENYLKSKIKYPAKARRKMIEGKVFVQFVVEKDGRVDGIRVVRSPDELLTKEAVRVVKAMPRWEPGMQNGVPVRYQFVLPVVFQLR